MPTSGASAATDDDAICVGLLPVGAFKQHLVELQEAESALTNLKAELARLHVPKSPKTPLMCYKDEWIPWFAYNNPNLPVEAVQQLMHNAFAQLDEAGKQPYVDLAMADRERYAQARADRKAVLARACVERRCAEDALSRLRTLLERHSH